MSSPAVLSCLGFNSRYRTSSTSITSDRVTCITGFSALTIPSILTTQGLARVLRGRFPARAAHANPLPVAQDRSYDECSQLDRAPGAPRSRCRGCFYREQREKGCKGESWEYTRRFHYPGGLILILSPGVGWRSVLAGVAQPAEHRFCKPRVVSSSLTASSAPWPVGPIEHDTEIGKLRHATGIGWKPDKQESWVDTQAAKGARL
jgi:hypothetical protein